MVLADDDFATLRAAIEEGRRVYDNLVKALALRAADERRPGADHRRRGARLPGRRRRAAAAGRAGADPLDQPDRGGRARAAAGLRGARAGPDAPAAARPAAPLLDRRCSCARSSCRPRSPRSRSACSSSPATTALSRRAGADHGGHRGGASCRRWYLLACRSLTRPNRELGHWSNPSVYVGIGVVLVLQALFVFAPVHADVFGSAALGARELAWAAVPRCASCR